MAFIRCILRLRLVGRLGWGLTFNIRMPLDLQLERKFEEIVVGTEIVMAWKEGRALEFDD